MSYYGLQVPKTQQPSKSLYTLYYPHTTDIKKRCWESDLIQFISIDPAIKNLAIRVEQRTGDNVVCLYSGKFSPWEMKTIDHAEANNMYNNINDILNNLHEYYASTHYVLIEKQLPTNYQATRVAQHILSYFLLTLKDLPLLPSIIELDAKVKGKMLGAPKCNKNELKKWAVEKATELSLKRNDEYTLSLLKKNKKKDDLADVVCQIEGFCIMMNI
ncbi:MAG TPA: hypothetical protein VLG50_08050 [Candidatus Saccharimonadales bacterium]|nr:hypothetical protein [Candidatus Saccharimonadales bacterium]